MALRRERARARAASPAARLTGPALTAAVAAAVGAVALNGGGYGLGIRNPAGILVWWTLGLAVALRVWPRAPLPRAARIAGALLAGLAVLTAASAAFGSDAEAALDEAGRTTLYLGAFLLVAHAARPGTAARWSDGLAAAIAGVGLLALASRLLPGLGLSDSASRFFEGEVYLSYPLDYWNALAAFIALGLPLLLRAALTAPRAAAGAVALAPFPALVGALYLTSSRGGMLVALLCVATFAVLCAERARAVVAAAIGTAGGLAAVWVLTAREAVVDGPFGTPEVAAQGRSAALLILLVCVATGAAWAAAGPSRMRLPAPGPRLKRIAALAAAAVAVGALAAADPASRFSDFRAAPPNPFSDTLPAGADLGTASHLTSGTGSGRWQFWQAAADQFADRPLLGHGAGSYEAWWAQNGTIAYFTRQAHSLYLETLAELGIAGLLLLAGLLATVAVCGASRLRAAAGAERTTLAALAAAGVGFGAGAGIDWLWEVPAVALIGIVVFALLTGPATGAASGAPVRRVVLPATALVAIALLALPWLAQRETRESRRAAMAGDVAAAVGAARAAERLTPWAASPRLQHALALEAGGDFSAARDSIAAAIDRDPQDWRLHVVAERLARADGDPAAAAAAGARARALNPRSPAVKDVSP